MKKPICFAVLGGLMTFYCAGCIFGSDDKDGHKSTPFAKHIEVVLSADRNPEYMGTARITCKYVINYPRDHSDTLMFEAQGYFIAGEPTFSIESGDSCWVDSVESYTVMEHSIVVRALKRGRYLIDAMVSAPLDSTWVLGNGATIYIDVK